MFAPKLAFEENIVIVAKLILLNSQSEELADQCIYDSKQLIPLPIQL